MGIYNFAPEDAERFASEIRIKTRRRGNQLEFLYCPYCRGAGKDNEYRFGINLDNGQFECKRSSCGAKGNMITLSKDFGFSLGKYADAYYRSADYSTKRYKRFSDSKRHFNSTDAAEAYLTSRGINTDIVRKYEVTTKSDDDNILVFPFKNPDGEMEFIKYRAIVRKSKGNKEWTETGCKPILFGMNHCDPKNGEPLIITEGQIDSLSVSEAGYKNAVSVPLGCNGFTWVPHCYDFVSSFQKIIVFGDCENGRITLSEEISKRWKNKVSICRAEDYRDCKDANELLQKYGASAIVTAIENAEPTFTAGIKPLAKVRRVDIEKIPAISTKMESLDGILSGGFHLGQLAVLTGKRGEGKSTIASMWGAHAIEQNYNCFFYSGELMDFYFRNWMDCQVTGKKDIRNSDNDVMDQWYGDRAFIYDNDIVKDDEIVTLLESVETAIVQRNCKFVLLDNLMTALDVDINNDLYRAQSKFVGDLATLAKRYEVFILLIAHPRKSIGAISNDDVSGTSNITDKADIVMSFGRPDKRINARKTDGDADEDDYDEYERRIRVIKNRLTGKLTDENGIHLVYDPGSRRIAENTSDFFKMRFTLDEDLYSFDSVDENDYIPF